jgi:hypothetical protein
MSTSRDATRGELPLAFRIRLDFPGSGPNLLHLRDDHDDDDDDDETDGPQEHDRDGEHRRRRGVDRVGIGLKSGIYWALNPDNGAIVVPDTGPFRGASVTTGVRLHYAEARQVCGSSGMGRRPA